jgi:hypothetical protein
MHTRRLLEIALHFYFMLIHILLGMCGAVIIVVLTILLQAEHPADANPSAALPDDDMPHSGAPCHPVKL